MYDAAYHLNSDPFRLSPDHRFCFRHKSYAKNKAYLDYALQRAEGFVMITGAPGTGKTTLLNDVLANIDKTNIVTARIVTTQLSAEDLLRMVAFSFRINIENADKATTLQHLEIFLHKLLHNHRRPLLVIDEAQDLENTALEEIRLLTNLQINNRPLLQVFLVGQENLLDIIEDPKMEQLHQRFIASSHLEPMDVKETATYVIHRLRMSGWHRDPMISNGALRRIHIFSRGIPRRVNQICSRVLLYGAVENKHTLTGKDIQEVIKELTQEHLVPQNLSDQIDELHDEDMSFSEIDAFEIVETIAIRSVKKINKQFPEIDSIKENETSDIIPSDKTLQCAPETEAEDNKPLTNYPNQSTAGMRMTSQAKFGDDKQVISKNETSDNPPVLKYTAEICRFFIKKLDSYITKILSQLEQNVQQRFLVSIAISMVVVLGAILIFPEDEPQAQASTEPNVVNAKPGIINQEASEIALHQNEAAEPEPEILAPDSINITQALAEQALEYEQIAPGIYKIRMNVGTLFSRGSAVMPPLLQSTLHSLASVLSQQDAAVIHIIGHCDSTGSPQRNDVLSELRAKVVADFMVSKGIPLHRLTAEGRGSSEAISDMNPQLNRRVELYIETIEDSV